MSNRLTARFLLLLSFFILLALPAACRKKAPAVSTPPPPPPTRAEAPRPDAPGPVIEISASPGTIRRGQQTELRWKSEHASSVVIDSGVGSVAASGSLTVTPLESTTYTATARGAGGESRNSTRVTVVRGDDVAVTSTDIEQLQQAIEDGRVKPVFFDYDKAELGPEAKRALEENAKWFRKFPDVPIVIEGHCDERGTEEYNLALGDRRALAAKTYLVQLGIPADRLETISYGEERPFATEHNEAAWRLNRRAHFTARGAAGVF